MKDTILKRTLIIMFALFAWVAFAGLALAQENPDEPVPPEEDPDEPIASDDDDDGAPDDDDDYEPGPMTYCENDAGHCDIGAYGGSCDCYSGQGEGWADSHEGDDDDDDDVPPPTEDECLNTLIEICGTEAPSLDACSEEDLEYCVEALYLVTNTCFDENDVLTDADRDALLEGEWVDGWAGMVLDCCTADEEETDEMNEMIACLEESGDCEECGFTGGDDPVGDDDDDEIGVDDDDDDEVLVDDDDDNDDDDQSGEEEETDDDDDDTAKNSDGDDDDDDDDDETSTDAGDDDDDSDDDDDGGCSVRGRSNSGVFGLMSILAALGLLFYRRK